MRDKHLHVIQTSYIYDLDSRNIDMNSIIYPFYVALLLFYSNKPCLNEVNVYICFSQKLLIHSFETIQ